MPPIRSSSRRRDFTKKRRLNSLLLLSPPRQWKSYVMDSWYHTMPLCFSFVVSRGKLRLLLVQSLKIPPAQNSKILKLGLSVSPLTDRLSPCGKRPSCTWNMGCTWPTPKICRSITHLPSPPTSRFRSWWLIGALSVSFLKKKLWLLNTNAHRNIYIW